MPFQTTVVIRSIEASLDSDATKGEPLSVAVLKASVNPHPVVLLH